MKKIGLIGAGNMGGAILRGMLTSGYASVDEMMVCEQSVEKLQAMEDEFPELCRTNDARTLAQECRMILLAVKPQVLGSVLDEIHDCLNDRAVISIAAGWTTAMLQEKLAGTNAAMMRVMPNTPALVGAGMTAICHETTFSEEDFAYAQGIFDAIGETIILDEHLFDGVTAVSGSSPAYVFILVEAMADAAVKEGIPRTAAIKMAAQAVLGSAKMVLETGKHPAELKDAVCSPAGTTINAVEVLEKDGFRAAIQEAMAACADKSRKMAK